MHRKITPLAFFCLGACFSHSATLTIEGNGLTTLRDAASNPLTDGSIVQIGYFLGIDSSTSPADYVPADWGTFTPITGPGSPNTRVDVRTVTQGSFTSVYSIGTVVLDDTNSDTLPPIPARFGVRIFDTTDPGAIGTANFNTVSGSTDTWEEVGSAGGPSGFPLNLGFSAGGTPSNPQLSWQFGPSSAFQTVIPEPSSSIALLIGSIFLLGKRRR